MRVMGYEGTRKAHIEKWKRTRRRDIRNDKKAFIEMMTPHLIDVDNKF